MTLSRKTEEVCVCVFTLTVAALLGPPWITPAQAWTDCYGEPIVSPGGGEASGYFSSVGVAGRWAVVGERGDDNGGTVNAGIGYIFEFDSGWADSNQTAVPVGSSAQLQDAFFGESVSIDGDWLALAGPGWDNLRGAVQLFKRNTSTDVWEHRKTLVPSVDQQNQSFGGTASFHHGVSNDGRLVAVGASNYEGTLGGQGAVYLYTYNTGISDWDETLLTADSPEANQKFGAAVAIDGNVLVVGAPGADVSGEEDAGMAHVYRNISGTWTFEQTLEAGTPDENDQFGWSVAIDGNYIIVGSQAGGSAGFATIFRYNSGTGDWDFDQTLSETGTVGYGFSVSIDAGRAVVGDASFVNPEDNSSCGAAFVYQRDVNGDWNLAMRLFPLCSAADNGDQFGGNVSISGDDVFIGAVRDTVTQTNEGTVFIFEDVPTCAAETECP
jgi:hypothetical protein